ncbi:MAG TPA: hypothetical protein VM324_07275 [Egibacteraceae bacterium]|jgi:hypothetical protein|nr:hypothetical protein [Egibacteraceae bacterium]
MPSDRETTTQLATFDPSLAEAVATVLRRQGVPAVTGPAPGPGPDDDVEVRVPPERRDEALGLLAGHMEEIRAIVHAGNSVTATPLPLVEGDAEQVGTPLVMSRVRSMGLGVAVLLVPLLVVTLAQTGLPVGYAIAVFFVGLVAVVYWRNRDDRA